MALFGLQSNMSHSTVSDIVQFVMHTVYEGDFDGSDPFRLAVCEPETIFVGEADFQYDEDNEDAEPEIPDCLSYFGWTLLKSEYCVNIGKQKKLLGSKWRLDSDPTICVYLTNTSQYGNCGYYDMAVVADTKKALEKFRADWAHTFQNNFEIKELDSVNNWM